MRYLVLAGVTVAALAGGLWYLVASDAPTAPTPVARSHDDEASGSAPSEPAPVLVQPRTSTEMAKALRRPTVQHRDEPAAPSLDSSEGSAKPVKPADPVLDALHAQVRATESAVLDCIEVSRDGGVVLDGTAAYGFTLVRKGKKFVIDSTTREYSPFAASVDACMQEAASAMTFEDLPPDAEQVTAYRKVTIKNGELKRNVIPEYHVGPVPPPP